MRDILAPLLDFRCGVGRTARQTATRHHFIVRDVVAHEDHFLVLQSILLAQLIVSENLDRCAEDDVLQSEVLVTHSCRFSLGTRDDGQPQSTLHGMLHGITVLDVDGSLWNTIGREIDGLAAEHTIDIEKHCFDFGKVVVDHWGVMGSLWELWELWEFWEF